MEHIFISLLFIFLFLLGIVGLLYGIKAFFSATVGHYYYNKPTNKIQWKAEETMASKKCRMMSDGDNENEFFLLWKTIPTEIPPIVRIFGDNDWNRLVIDSSIYREAFHFNNEHEFKEFVTPLKTLNDLRNFQRKSSDRIIWYEP
jgi:hypothetical protein